MMSLDELYSPEELQRLHATYGSLQNYLASSAHTEIMLKHAMAESAKRNADWLRSYTNPVMIETTFRRL